ncbi:RmlC-like cupin, partial [Pyrenochaeta sp. DS3sAY3a]
MASTMTTAKIANTGQVQLSGPEPKSLEDQYLATLPPHNVEALWTVLHKLVPPKPNPGAMIATWPYEKIRPTLIESGKIVSAEEAERRVLMLINPELEAPCTTDTIYAGLQLVLPNETAPAHRHVAFALRFIIEGNDGFTAVEGQKLKMERGDVILTPSWHWHDHGNEGQEPMIWLDGLDLPVFKFLRNNFAENYTSPRYPSEPVDKSAFKYPWAPIAEELNATKGPHSLYHYRLPNGGHLSKTISAQAERISAGHSTSLTQETCSFVYHVYEGTGYTTVHQADGSAKTVHWTKSDTFSIPGWSAITHTCTDSTGNAFLFAVNDRPIIESLGTYRKA